MKAPDIKSAASTAVADTPLQDIRYPWLEPPAAASMQPVAPGVYWLRMPLPFALDHINLWLLEDDAGWTIVDCGLCNDQVKALWHDLFVDQMHGRPVKRIIVTHFHPDHLGLAGWLAAKTGAPVLMTATEWQRGSTLYHDTDGRFSDEQVAFFRLHGLDEPVLASLAGGGNRYRQLISQPPDYVRIQDQETITVGTQKWRVIIGTGHAPEHACLYSEELGVLISGDQILPKITPNISLSASEPERNPLQMYLDSLTRFHPLPADTLVLPSHGRPFYGLHRRLQQIDEHHQERLQTVFNACDQPQSAAEIIPVMFKRELDSHQIMFAMGESLSHLACLEHQHRLQIETGSDGIIRYQRTPLAGDQ